jgi:hypothetical protein
MAQKETAEQKLLKIIQATKKAQEGSSASMSLSSPRRSSSFFAINVHHVNYLLIIAVIVSFLYLGFELRNGISLMQEDVSISVDKAIPKQTSNLFVPQMKSVAYYLDKITARNIFQPYEKKDPGTQVVATVRANFEKKMQKYRLVGVAWLDVPESATVMIEDKASGITRFLKEGDKLEDVTVKTIYTDRVVIGYENEEIVIKL